jgi:hypothetical protein
VRGICLRLLVIRKAFIPSYLEGFLREGWLAIKRTIDSLVSFKTITEAKKLALRNGVWFKTLSRVERGIIDLTVRYVECIKSVVLAKVVTAIMEKLQFAMESVVDRLVRTVGLPLARKISDIAVSWGNRLASMWANDFAFARFLVANYAKV